MAGNSRYIEGSYGNEFVGKEFKYDKLSILLNQTNKSYMNDGLLIYLDDICVLSYYFNNNKLHVIDGKWMELIDFISDELLEFGNIKNRNKVQSIINQKLYYSLVDYINVFLENVITKLQTYDYMNERLFDCGIVIKNNKTFYSILYNDEEVLRFNCTAHINTEDLIIYQCYFKSGNWINGFIEAINRTNEYSYLLKQEKTDNISESIIKRLNK